ncbi:MAG: DUF6142 family protein [Muribaculaceae bacterium]|nr:DUF6142 family protein [Roseburia sp.]MCM1431746.1 DUF6142 family protein [Muribaculaceae bacterium]MCM1493388.1 DUF6142 family protein [Muribaculaceae bacterium]
MNRRRRRQRGYKFTEKTHSKKGVAATVLATALLLLFAVFFYLSFSGDGNLNTYFGSAGVFAMLISVVAIALAAGSLGEEDSFKLFPRLGLFLSLLDAFCWIGTYVIGFMQ